MKSLQFDPIEFGFQISAIFARDEPLPIIEFRTSTGGNLTYRLSAGQANEIGQWFVDLSAKIVERGIKD